MVAQSGHKRRRPNRGLACIPPVINGTGAAPSAGRRKQATTQVWREDLGAIVEKSRQLPRGDSRLDRVASSHVRRPQSGRAALEAPDCYLPLIAMRFTFSCAVGDLGSVTVR